MATRGNVDPNKPYGRVVIKDFPGYVPNTDPHDVPPGVAVRQVNAMSLKPGELRVRPGFAVVRFDT
jgi:hypothetical protein